MDGQYIDTVTASSVWLQLNRGVIMVYYVLRPREWESVVYMHQNAPLVVVGAEDGGCWSLRGASAAV